MKRLITLVLLFGLCGAANADILNSLPKRENMAMASAPESYSGNILQDATLIVNYLGVKEGQAYNFNRHKWVTTTGATIISYTPWSLGLDVMMLNTDGVAGAVSWNVGNYLPVNNVPVMKYMQYLYIFAGLGAEQNAKPAFKTATILGAEFKFTF